jgi:hypothetical protein
VHVSCKLQLGHAALSYCSWTCQRPGHANLTSSSRLRSASSQMLFILRDNNAMNQRDDCRARSHVRYDTCSRQHSHATEAPVKRNRSSRLRCTLSWSTAGGLRTVTCTQSRPLLIMAAILAWIGPGGSPGLGSARLTTAAAENDSDEVQADLHERCSAVIDSANR